MKLCKYNRNLSNLRLGRKLAKCMECSIEYEIGIKDCCSEECFKKNIQKRINEATKNEKSHTNIISEDNS